MSFVDYYLRKEQPDYFPVSELISYVWTNFHQIKEYSDFLVNFGAQVVDVSDSPESSIVHQDLAEGPTIGDHFLVFREDDRIQGTFDLDFYGGGLANFRVQVFSKGMLLSRRRVMNKYKSLHDFVEAKLGKGRDDKELNRIIWRDSKNGLVVTLRRVTKLVIHQPPSISFTITKEEYAGPIELQQE